MTASRSRISTVAWGSSRSKCRVMWCPRRWGRRINGRHRSGATQRRQKRNILRQAWNTVVSHWLARRNCQIRNWQSRGIVSHRGHRIRERDWPNIWWSRDSLCHWFLCISIVASFPAAQPLVMIGHGKWRGERSGVMTCRPLLVVRIGPRAWGIRDGRGWGRRLHGRWW